MYEHLDSRILLWQMFNYDRMIYETEDGDFELDSYEGFIRISSLLIISSVRDINTASHIMEVLGHINKKLDNRFSCCFEDNAFWIFILLKPGASIEEIKDEAHNLFLEKKLLEEEQE